jgi:hypothetical protein
VIRNFATFNESVSEEDFNKQEVKELKRVLQTNNIPFKRPTEDAEMSLQLPNYLVFFFYKKDGEEQYNVGITPNMYHVDYLVSYTSDLQKVIDVTKEHLKKKYFAFQNTQGKNRSLDKIVREVEESLNEYGVEVFRTPLATNNLKLAGEMDIIINDEKGMVSFALLDNKGKYVRMGDKNWVIDLKEIVRAYKSLQQ